MLSLKVPKIKFPVSVEPGQHRHPPATLMLQAQLTRGQGHRRTAAAPLLTRFALNPLNNLQGTLCNTQRQATPPQLTPIQTWRQTPGCQNPTGISAKPLPSEFRSSRF